MDSSFSQKRKAKKTEWIKTILTWYLNGMNDKFEETTTNKDELKGCKFPLIKGKYPQVDGNKHIKTNAIFGKNFLRISLMLS